MTYYVVYVFQMAGLNGNIKLIASGVQYALFIIFTSFVFFFIDKTGCRPLLIYGAIGIGICQFVVGGMLGSYGAIVLGGVGDLPKNNVIIKVSGGPANTVIAFSYLLIIIYALTLTPVAWVYATEVWSLETRATGMGGSCKLALQFRTWSLCTSCTPQHYLQNIHYLQCAVHGSCCAGLLHLSRDLWQNT